MARIEFEDQNGKTTILKDELDLEAGTVVDTSFMSVRALRAFLREQLTEAKEMGVLFFASKSNHDEGIRSDNFWSCGCYFVRKFFC